MQQFTEVEAVHRTNCVVRTVTDDGPHDVHLDTREPPVTAMLAAELNVANRRCIHEVVRHVVLVEVLAIIGEGFPLPTFGVHFTDDAGNLDSRFFRALPE